MEPVITPQLIAATGVTISEDQSQAFLEYINAVLEERIGQAIVENLNDNELEELADLQEARKDEQVQVWLETNVPDLDEIVNDEIDIILGEAAQHHTDFSSK
ncbi:hypothetical protein BH10PAT4_BH10PAT4_4240 [soil metagenome]